MKVLKRLYQTIWSYNRDHRVVHYFLPVFSVTVNSPICLISQINQLNNNNFQKYIHTEVYILLICKVNSVQEACAKCFAVHILKFEILQTT